MLNMWEVAELLGSSNAALELGCRQAKRRAAIQAALDAGEAGIDPYARGRPQKSKSATNSKAEPTYAKQNGLHILQEALVISNPTAWRM